MAQTLFKASGITGDNAEALKDAGSAVDGVKWVNVNVSGDNIVVTHEDDFDAGAFVDALKGADGSVDASPQ